MRNARGLSVLGVVGLMTVVILGFQRIAAATEDEMMYALILDDEGVVINVAVYHPVDSAGWLELMQDRGAHIIINEQNTVGIGSVLQPDGSFAREQTPPPPSAPEPPDGLPAPTENDAQWNQYNAPASVEPAPRRPVIRDPELAKHLGVAPADSSGVVTERGRTMTALIIENGVVVNAAVYHTIDSLGWLELMKARGSEVIIVEEHSAGIGWTVHTDGAVIPPAPRSGLVWNGAEWRSPGTETVERPSEVRGWMTDRIVPIEREPQEQERPGVDGSEMVDALMYGVLIVPDEALEGAPTRERLAERSIVMLESHGETVPVLARCDGLQWLSECLDAALDGAISAYEENSGGLVAEAEQKGLRAAVRRIADSFLQLWSGSST